MIYTVTLNPSIDYIMNVKDLRLGEVNRTSDDFMLIGGKGINVSRILKAFGVENVALGFIGGFTGKHIEESLKKWEITTDFINVLGDSRINIKIKHGEESEINGCGPDISKENVKELLNKILQLNRGDTLVLSGSIPKTMPNNLYKQIEVITCNKGIKVVVDCSGSALLEAIKEKPFLIKPNISEMEELFNKTLKKDEDFIECGNELLSLGAQNVIISMGEKGALLINDAGIFKGIPPKGKVINSVGAGDSLIGGFLASYEVNRDILEAFKTGIATGSATAFSMDLCNKKEACSYMKGVEIKALSKN